MHTHTQCRHGPSAISTKHRIGPTLARRAQIDRRAHRTRRSAAMIYVDRQCERTAATWYYNIAPCRGRRLQPRRYPPTPAMLVAARVPTGTAMAVPRCSTGIRTCLDYYGDSLCPVARAQQTALRRRRRPVQGQARFVALGIHRSNVEGPWRQEQSTAVTALAPHLQRALEHPPRISLRSRDSAAMSSGLDRMVMGVILIDHLF